MSAAKQRHRRRRRAQRAQARVRRSYSFSFRLTSYPVLVTDGPGVILIPDWAGDD